MVVHDRARPRRSAAATRAARPPGSGPGGGAGSPGGGAAAQGPSVRVTPTTVRVSRSGTVRLRVSCPRQAGRCRVTLRLTLKRKLAATRTITVTGGRSSSVTLTLSRAARRALARTASLPAVVTAVAPRSGRQPDEDHTNLDPPAGASELTPNAEHDQ